jgi:hypothetical protein
MFVAPMFQKSRRVVTMLGQLARANQAVLPGFETRDETTSQIWMD